MINLNDYINKTIDFELNGQITHIKLPSSKVLASLSSVQKTIDDKDTETMFSARPKQAAVLMSFNTEGITYTAEQAAELPDKALLQIINAVLDAKVEADTDPNSKSQSQAETSEPQ